MSLLSDAPLRPLYAFTVWLDSHVNTLRGEAIKTHLCM